MFWFNWAQFWNQQTRFRIMTLRNQLDNFFGLNTLRKDPCISKSRSPYLTRMKSISVYNSLHSMSNEIRHIIMMMLWCCLIELDRHWVWRDKSCDIVVQSKSSISPRDRWSTNAWAELNSIFHVTWWLFVCNCLIFLFHCHSWPTSQYKIHCWLTLSEGWSSIFNRINKKSFY